MILSIFLAGTMILGGQPGSNLLVPLPAALLAGLSAVTSLIAYMWAPQKYLHALAFGNYLLLGATVGVLISLTGEVYSPYLVLWMLLTIFAGLFNTMGLAIAFIAVNAALIYNFLFDPLPVTRDYLIIFLLALETPIAVSYIIWHEKGAQDKNKTQAFDALAKQLSQVANKSEIVINAIADGVVAIDSEGQIQLINPAAQKLLGWSKHDALNLDYRSVLKLSDASGHELTNESSPIQQVLLFNKPITNNNLTLTTRSNKKLLLSLVVSPVGDVAPASGAIAVFRDITSEKEEERQKAEFISTASHEMRTPVAAIEGYLGLALNPNTAAIDDKARAYLMKAHESTQHLGRLFQDLLTVSRAEDGRLIPKPTVIDIVAFMREITDGLAPKAQGKGLFLYFKPGSDGATDGPHTVTPVFYSLLDQGHLREISNNLVDNAIKYTKQGNVTVDVTGDDSNVVISVNDTGIGIPPEDAPHLFQKFYRIDNSDTREIGGTGLGLFICRRLAEANNGKIWVESTYGKGSTFSVQFPRITHEKAAELLKGEQQASTVPQPGLPIQQPKPAALQSTSESQAL